MTVVVSEEVPVAVDVEVDGGGVGVLPGLSISPAITGTANIKPRMVPAHSWRIVFIEVLLS